METNRNSQNSGTQWVAPPQPTFDLEWNNLPESERYRVEQYLSRHKPNIDPSDLPRDWWCSPDISSAYIYKADWHDEEGGFPWILKNQYDIPGEISLALAGEWDEFTVAVVQDGNGIFYWLQHEGSHMDLYSIKEDTAQEISANIMKGRKPKLVKKFLEVRGEQAAKHQKSASE